MKPPWPDIDGAYTQRRLWFRAALKAPKVAADMKPSTLAYFAKMAKLIEIIPPDRWRPTALFNLRNWHKFLLGLENHKP